MNEKATTPAIDPPDVLQEVLDLGGIGMAAVGKLFPNHRGTGHADASTAFRWATAGIKLRDGRTLKLETVRVGNKTLTSRPALERFIRTQSAATAAPTPAQPPVAGDRKRRAAKATKRLQKMGA